MENDVSLCQLCQLRQSFIPAIGDCGLALSKVQNDYAPVSNATIVSIDRSDCRICRNRHRAVLEYSFLRGMIKAVFIFYTCVKCVDCVNRSPRLSQLSQSTRGHLVIFLLERDNKVIFPLTPVTIATIATIG